MVSTQGEIRVGPLHQVRLPEVRVPPVRDSGNNLSINLHAEEEGEDLRWTPCMIADEDLLVYLSAARSMAAFAGMCDGGSPEDGCMAASRDDTTINALDVLHQSGYDTSVALQALVKCPVPKGVYKKWSEEETKRFVKGLRQFGKNFFRIRKDLLPHKDTAELVEFYYLWKKTPGANNNRPHRRRRQGSLRRIRNTRTVRGVQPKETDVSVPVVVGARRSSPNPKEHGDGSSGTEEENSEDDSDSKDQNTYRCHHCLATSPRDWQQGGKSQSVLCIDCRSYFNKYGDLRPLGNGNSGNITKGEAPYLFRPVQVDAADESSNRMRTRTRTKEQTAKGNSKRGSGIEIPESEIDKKICCKSVCNNAASPSDKIKRKSPPQSLATENGSVVDEAEDIEPDNGLLDHVNSTVCHVALNAATNITSSSSDSVVPPVSSTDSFPSSDIISSTLHSVLEAASLSTNVSSVLEPVSLSTNVPATYDKIEETVENNIASTALTCHSQTPTIVVNNIGGSDFNSVSSECSVNPAYKSCVQNSVLVTKPVISLKVPVPLVSSSIDDLSGTKKPKNDHLNPPEKKHHLGNEDMKVFNIQQTEMQSEHLRTGDHQSVLKYTDECVRVLIKREGGRETQIDRNETESGGSSSSVKSSNDSGMVLSLTKAVIKDDVEEISSVLTTSLPCSSANLILKDDSVTQSHSLVPLIGDMSTILSSVNVHPQDGNGFPVTPHIKLEPGTSREQSSPISQEVSASAPSEITLTSTNLIQMQQLLTTGTTPNITTITFRHSGERTPPTVGHGSTTQGHIQSSGCSTIVCQTSDMRQTIDVCPEVRSQTDTRLISELRQSSLDIRKGSDVNQQSIDIDICHPSGLRQSSDIRTMLSDNAHANDVHSHALELRADVGQISDTLQMSPVGISLEKSASKVQVNLSNENDREQKSVQQSLQLIPSTISGSQTTVAQPPQLHSFSSPQTGVSAHQTYSFLTGPSYQQRLSHSLGLEKNINKIHISTSNAAPGFGIHQQNEPQNLKIKQEIIPLQEQVVPSDPLQSLKEVKIPGCSGTSSSGSHSLTGTNNLLTVHSAMELTRPSSQSMSTSNFLGPTIENIKKEPENYLITSSGVLPSKSPVLQISKPQNSLSSSDALNINVGSCTPPLPHVLANTPPVVPISSHHVTPQSAPSCLSSSPTSRLTPSSLHSGSASVQQPVLHPSQQVSPLNRQSPNHPHPPPHPHPTPHPHSSPFIGPPGHPTLHHHPHHSLIHHPLFAAAAVHAAAATVHHPYHHPYAAYGYPFAYPYGPPMPQPHPVPPPHHSTSPATPLTVPPTSATHSHRLSHDQTKLETRTSSQTSSAVESTAISLHASQHTTHSTMTTRREISASSEESSCSSSERHHAQELTAAHHHHHSTHHSSVQHQVSSEKQSTHPTSAHSVTISHSASSSLSSTVQHKIVSTKIANTSSISSPSCHVSATMSSASSVSTSISFPPMNHGNNHHSQHHAHTHSHHHQHQHHLVTSQESLSPPSNQVLVQAGLSMPMILGHNSPSSTRPHGGLSSHSGHHHNVSHNQKTTTSSSAVNPPVHHHPSTHTSLMVQPGVPATLSHHSLSGVTSAGPHLDALRAHAHAHSINMQQQQQQQHQTSHSQGAVPSNVIHPSVHSPVQIQSSGPPLHSGSHHTRSHLSQGHAEDLKPEMLTADLGEHQMIVTQQEEEEIPSPSHVPRGPSPEPKIEDSECHRSQSAIFLRHWNRGEYNSCTRTDLTFKPVPDSKLARKREERLRKQAEKEREEREKAASHIQAHKISTPEKPEGSKPPSRGPIETITSPYDRFPPRQGYSDTPALRQLSEYARPHGGFSPGTLPSRSGTLGLPPQCIDPMLHYQLNSMYGSGARERLELEHLEREKRERELRERELSDRLKDELMKNAGAAARVANPLDQHWLELHRRYAGLGTGGPPQGAAATAALHQFGIYPPGSGPGQATLNQIERERLERLGIPTGPTGPHGPPPVGPSGPHTHPHPNSVAAAQLEAAERLALATDPMVRLQMAGISPEYHAHTHAHTHAHSHTHLHLHPSQQAQAAQAQQEAAGSSTGFPLPASASSSYPRPTLLPPRETAMGLHHPSDILGRGPGYADQLAHQFSAQAAHEQLQRHILLERERFSHPHPTLVAQHEEYIRQQREREIKVRALEEAARSSRS